MITELTNNSFEAQTGTGVAVVEFYSPTCQHCKRTETGLAELSEEFEGRSVFGKVNIADELSLAERWDVQSVPTLLFLKDGDVKEKLVGFTHKLIIAENIKKLL